MVKFRTDTFQVLVGTIDYNDNGEEVVDVVEGGNASAAARIDHSGHRLVAKTPAIGMEQTIHEALELTGNTRIVHRSGKDEAICSENLSNDVVEQIILHASADFAAFSAGDAAMDVRLADVDDFRIHTLPAEFACQMMVFKYE